MHLQGRVLATKDWVRAGFYFQGRGAETLNSYIRQTAQKLKDEFESDVPKTVDELCSLPGVGPKMAYLTLQVCRTVRL